MIGGNDCFPQREICNCRAEPLSVKSSIRLPVSGRALLRKLEARIVLEQDCFRLSMLVRSSIIIASMCIVFAGCATIRVTDPAETATEQFLQTEAIDV